MTRRKRSKGKRKTPRRGLMPYKDSLSLYAKITDLKQQADELSKTHNQNDDRLSNLEIHLNLLTRLLTTLCIDKFGIKMGVLKRLVKKVEKEAIRDSQILELESLYKLSPDTEKKPPPPPDTSQDDPWGQVS